MILDSTLQFDPAGTAITASAASTNVLDLGINSGVPNSAAGGGARDLGIGDDPALKLLIISNGAFASADGTATLNIQFQGAPDNGSGAPGTYTTYAESGALTITQLNSYPGGVAQGVKLFRIDVPEREAGSPLPRYYRLNYVVGTENFTAGTVQAYMTTNVDASPAYPSGFSTAGVL